MQTSVFNKKRLCFMAAVLLILAHLFIPITSYAADDERSSELEQMYEEAEIIAGKQTNSSGEVDETAKESCEEVLERIKESTEKLENNPTVRGGYDVIDDICTFGGHDIEGIDLTFQSIWKAEFREVAQSMGIEFGDLIPAVTGGTQEINDEIQDAAIKVNILTWNNSTVGGEQVQTVNSGAIQDMIDGIEKSGIFTDFMTPLAAIGIALVVAFGGSSLITLSMERSVTSEAVTREFIKIIIGVFIIYNFRTIALAVMGFGSWVIQTLQVSFSNTDYAETVEYALVQSFANVMEEHNPITNILTDASMGIGNIATGIAQQFGNIFNSFSGFIGNGIIQLASSLAIYSVAIEIGVRYVFTPIAIADLYSEKFRSNGVMWLKKLLACVLTGAVIYMIIFVTDAFKDSVGATFSVITNMAINLTMIGMLFRARQIANDIVGCH